jgi:hypothetical protein
MYTPNVFHTNYSTAMNTKQPVVGGNIHHNEEKSLYKKKNTVLKQSISLSVFIKACTEMGGCYCA